MTHVAPSSGLIIVVFKLAIPVSQVAPSSGLIIGVVASSCALFRTNDSRIYTSDSSGAL